MVHVLNRLLIHSHAFGVYEGQITFNRRLHCVKTVAVYRQIIPGICPPQSSQASSSLQLQKLLGYPRYLSAEIFFYGFPIRFKVESRHRVLLGIFKVH